MSWYHSHHLTSVHLPFMRLSAMHKGISIGLLCSVGTAVILPTAQAATMGKTVITSVQHQPLTASITVTSIRSADFSARLASPIIYQQLGLTPQPSMSVSFVPTSATTGTVVITSTQPITMPFTDVVLALNDQGQRKVIPKTLLMPLATSDSIKQSSSILATARQSEPSTLIVNAHTANPLVVKRGAPPTLANVKSVEPVIQVNKTVTLPINNTTLLSDKKTTSPQILVASRKAPPSLFSSPKPAEPVYNAGLAIDPPVKKSPSLAESNTSSPQIIANSRQISPPAFVKSKPALATSKIVKQPVSNTSQPIELSVKKSPSLTESNASSSQIIANSQQISLPLLATPKPAFAMPNTAMPDFNTSQPIELPVKKSPSLAESNTSSPQILVASRQAPPPLFANPKSVEPIFNASQPIKLPLDNAALTALTALAAAPVANIPQILAVSLQAPPPLFASPITQKTDIVVQSRVPHNTISINERRINSVSAIQSRADVDQVVPLIASDKTFDDISSFDTSAERIIELASVAKIDSEQKIQQASRITSYPSLNTQISRKIMTINLNFNETSPAKMISTKDHTQNRLASPLAAQKMSTPSYIVQKNDNLWVISQQVAEQNNLDVLMVMNQIKSQNSDAFIKKDSNHLKVDAKLDLSYYATVPSQQGLQAAIADKRQQRLNSNKTV
ncbi:MAG: hypothetical protein L0G25_01485 [Psychrobacter sp.]|nr:hypothetical protein [Psychrobacter sp.]